MNLFTKGLKSEYGNVMIVSASFSAAFGGSGVISVTFFADTKFGEIRRDISEKNKAVHVGQVQCFTHKIHIDRIAPPKLAQDFIDEINLYVRAQQHGIKIKNISILEAISEIYGTHGASSIYLDSKFRIIETMDKVKEQSEDEC